MSSIAPLPPSDKLLSRRAPLEPVYRCAGLVAHQADDVFGLWDAWEREAGGECPIPYWAVVWPAAALIARHILEGTIEVAGRRVLDLGCGGGAVSIAAAIRAAREVIAADIDPVALHVARRNAAANGRELSLTDSDYLETAAAPEADIVIAADMFYERNRAESTLTFLRGMDARGAQVFVGDAQRAFAPARGVEPIAMERIPVNRELEGTPVREVRLLRLQSPPDIPNG